MFLIIMLLAIGVMPAFAQNGQVASHPAERLKVLTKEVHAAPVVSFQVWCSRLRNEQLGKTGLSHIVEHMQFKGTKSLKRGEIDKLMRDNGAINNAATWKDFTFFWERSQ